MTPPAGATGNGTAAFTVAANPDPVARNGTLTVAGREIAISQAAACVFTLTPSTTSFPATGGSGSVAVTARAGCSWTAAKNVPWITFTGATSGNGNGTIPFSVDPNFVAERLGAISVGNASVAITQAGARTLLGRITNALNAAPIVGASISVNQGQFKGTTLTDAQGGYQILGLNPGLFTVTVTASGFRGQTATPMFPDTSSFDFSTALTPLVVDLVVTFDPNPVSVNPNDVGCGQTGRFCWPFDLVIQERSGTTAPVSAATVNWYNSAGVFLRSEPATFTVGDVPGGSTRRIGLLILGQTPDGGQFEVVVSGADIYDRSFSSTSSPRLVYNTFIISPPIGTLLGLPGTGPPMVVERAAQPGPRPIRRQ